jgi:ADP-ribose pyrophosphatase YjhB (NUDIX family)
MQQHSGHRSRHRKSSPPRQVYPVVPISPLSYNSQVFQPTGPIFSSVSPQNYPFPFPFPILRPTATSFDTRYSNLPLDKLFRNYLSDVSIIFMTPKGILLIHDSNSDKWMVPSSVMNVNESYEAAYLRIFKEKVGVDIDKSKSIHIDSQVRRHSNGKMSKVFMIASSQELPDSPKYISTPFDRIIKLIKDKIPYNRVNSLANNNISLFNHLSELEFSKPKTEETKTTETTKPTEPTVDEIRDAIEKIYLPSNDKLRLDLLTEFLKDKEIKSIVPKAPDGSERLTDEVLQKALDIIFMKSQSIRDDIKKFRVDYKR